MKNRERINLFDREYEELCKKYDIEVCEHQNCSRISIDFIGERKDAYKKRTYKYTEEAIELGIFNSRWILWLDNNWIKDENK